MTSSISCILHTLVLLCSRHLCRGPMCGLLFLQLVGEQLPSRHALDLTFCLAEIRGGTVERKSFLIRFAKLCKITHLVFDVKYSLDVALTGCFPLIVCWLQVPGVTCS